MTRYLITWQDQYHEDAEDVEEETWFEDDPEVDPNDADGFASSNLPEDACDEASIQLEANELNVPEMEPEDVPEVEPEAPPAAAAPPPDPDHDMDGEDDVPQRAYAGRRIESHPKSFEFSIFYIRYRDDQSLFYPDRKNSWWTLCPYHDGCNKSVQVNQPTEDGAVRRLMQWCLDAPQYATKEESRFWILEKFGLVFGLVWNGIDIK